MDETQPTKSEAAAVRRRRSSILKSQKATRTPFSELEFNVATPTDATKSRRVSFSRRTGVAEFVTNEATTTWKNFYEEHNKSLESSGNDSAAANRQSVGHLGRRSYFDKQFQDDEALAVDTLNPRESNVNISFNTTNFADQIAALENTGDGKNLSAPHNQFNLSSLTEHQTKLFEDNIGNPGLGEVTDKIDFNFSVNPIKINENDDLEEIQKDIQMQQASSNIICHGPMRDRKSVSEYIEIDELNMTRATANVEESDMSITDTIHSPKVQNVSKNTSIKNASISGAKASNPDWLADKENIVVNPYIAPRESDNFAVSEEADQVLVFDGKRLTVQSQNEALVVKTEPEVTEKKVPTRKTIVLNLHDDLPNFVDDLSISRQLANKFEKSDSKINMSDISFTQALPAKVVLPEENKRRTIVFDDGDISVTQGISAKVIIPEEHKNKRQTIVFDDIDISMTQVHGNIISEIQTKSHDNHKNTVIYEDDANISMTQVLPSKIIDTQKRKTIIYDNDDCNISLTQIIKGTNISAQTKEVEKEDICDISMTQAVSNVLLTQSSTKRTTIVFENDANDISMTQALPSNVILSMHKTNEKDTNFAEKSSQDVKAKTSIFHDDVLMSEIVPSDIADSQTTKVNNITNIENDLDISMTQALPVNILENKENKRKTIVFDDENVANISVTQAVPTNIFINQDANLNHDAKRNTLVFDDDCGDISVTQAVPSNIMFDTMNISKHVPIEKEVKNDELSKTQDVLDEINSIIDHKEKSMLIKDCYQDLDINSIKIDSELASKSMASNTINMSKSEEARKSIDSFNQDALVYQALFKRGKWHRKKSHVPVYTDDADVQEAAVECSSSEIKPATSLEIKPPTETNTKTVLNELLCMSNASINFDNEIHASIPLKKEPSKKSVTNEDSIGVSQFQINVALEKKQPKETNENDQSEFQMDIPLEKVDDLKPNTVMQLLPTRITSVIETGEEVPNEDAEINKKDEIIKPDINDQSVTNIVEDKVDLETKELSLENKSEDINEVQAELEKSLAIPKQIEPLTEKSLEDENKMDVESEKITENEIIEDKSEATSIVRNVSDDNTIELKKESFIHENFADSDNETTFAPSRRLSKLPSRQSLAPSRDEFLNDITLAQQMLQTTKFELENTSSMEDATVECTLDDEDANLTKTDSPIVVKKLQFEDETLSDTSDQNVSALKKASYGETSKVTENKAIVIPQFLQDVSEDVKDIMRDLVKPMPDTMPFETNTDLLRRTSTCSMQIQASLIASSQIEVASNDSYNMLEATSTGRMKSVSFANEFSSKTYEFEKHNKMESKPIVFDPNNPLNNVFITPIGPSGVHSYNPLKSSENDENNAIKENRKPIVDNIVLISNTLSPKGQFKNSEVNTTITVKENSELLRLHSSLTVIDDDQGSNSSTTDLENKESSDTSLQSVTPFKKQHVNIEGVSSSLDNKGSTKSISEVDTDSNNSLISVAPNKAQKRYYSPNKQCSTNSVDVTPKPSSKIMRHSSSPTITLVDGSLTSMEFDLEFEGVWAKDGTNINNYKNITNRAKTEKEKQVKKRIYSPQKHDTNETTPKPTSKLHKTSKSPTKIDAKRDKSPRKNSQSKLRVPSNKLGTKVTVQSAVVSYEKSKKTSPTRNKNDYDPELNMTAKSVARSIIQSSAIASKIDRLPFMSDGECEWEACTRDAWVFSLLKGRVRLCVNFARTKNHLVTDDTPIDNVIVNVNRVDIHSPLASLCVGFAAETMTTVVNTTKNSQTPQLLGRCAGIARLATQWARAMVDAKARLGFTLSEDGRLTYKVANLSHRSVYQVSMRVTLTNTGGVPWPRASDVTMATVVGDDVTDDDVRVVAACAPSGWGHVPVTAWTIFRHLKNKKQKQLLDLV